MNFRVRAFFNGRVRWFGADDLGDAEYIAVLIVADLYWGEVHVYGSGTEPIKHWVILAGVVRQQ